MCRLYYLGIGWRLINYITDHFFFHIEIKHHFIRWTPTFFNDNSLSWFLLLLNVGFIFYTAVVNED